METTFAVSQLWAWMSWMSRAAAGLAWLLTLASSVLVEARGLDADCACFSLCTPEEIRHFLLRLPLVESTESPWYSYVLAIYNTNEVPLPIDMRTFGAFQLPRGSQSYGQLHIPWAQSRCQSAGGRSSAPQCARTVCERWLNLTAAREEEVAVWEAVPLPKSQWRTSDLVWPDGRLPIKGFSVAAVPREFAIRANLSLAPLGSNLSISDASIAASSHVAVRVLLDGELGGGGRASFEPYHLYMWPESTKLRLPYPPDTWLEVGRFYYGGSPEGILYGCWFTALHEPFPRGSGVFVFTGRTIALDHKAKAKAWAFRLGKANVAPAPAPSGALEAEAAWAATAAKAWSRLALQSTPSAHTANASLPECGGSHGASGMACAPAEPVRPVAAAAWAAAAAASAAAQLSRGVHGGNATAAAAAVAARAAVAAVSRVLLASAEVGGPHGGQPSAADVAAAASASALAAQAAQAAREAADFASPGVDPRVARSNVKLRSRNHCSPWGKAPHDLVALSRAALPGGSTRGLGWIDKFGDTMIAACAREMGFESVQMLAGASSRPEFVLTGPECTWPGQQAPVRECGAPETPMRTGWHAERACTCISGKAQACGGGAKEGKRVVINCGHAPLCHFRDLSAAGTLSPFAAASIHNNSNPT